MKLCTVCKVKKYNFLKKKLTCGPSIYTMDHPDLSVSNFMEKSIGLKRVQSQLLAPTLKDKALFYMDKNPPAYSLGGPFNQPTKRHSNCVWLVGR